MPPSERNEGGCQPGMPGASVAAGAVMFGSAASCGAYVGDAGLMDRRCMRLANGIGWGGRPYYGAPGIAVDGRRVLQRVLSHWLGLDVVVVGEGVAGVEDGELVIFIAAIGFADVVSLLIEGAGLRELR